MLKTLGVISLSGTLFFAGAASSAWAQQVAGKAQLDMKRQVEKKLTTDAELKNNRIGVQVDNSVVTLTGSVDTAAEKTKAEELARVDGIARVVNQLEVGSQGAGAAVSDTVITAKVKAAMMGDDALKPSNISVTTNNGVVILTGTVASAAASQHATTVAQNTNGVKSVSNKLQLTTK